ncbi:MAG: hypothetical protein M3Q66_04555, partial [Chloroflexota bacterium]|nr:hypothetical protein [Chloroflexota bacterium]
ALDRLDAIVFTGGIGANAGPIRRRIVGRLATLGVDPAIVDEFGRSGDPETADSVVVGRSGPMLVRINAREDVILAEQAASIAAGGASTN